MRWGKAWSKAMFSMIDDNGCNDDDNNHVDEDQDEEEAGLIIDAFPVTRTENLQI